MNKSFTILLLSLFFHLSVQAGEWSTDFLSWGKGVIMPVNSWELYSEYQQFYFPLEIDIPVYNGPGGAVIGTLYLPLSNDENGEHEGYYTAAGTKNHIAVNRQDLRRITYEHNGLLFFEEKDGFVRVLHHSLNTQVWIRMKNLEIYDLKAITWMEFMKSNRTSYSPHDRIGMNLRKSPEVKDNKIATMRGDLFSIQLTGTTQGLWAEVKVEQYDVHPCEGDSKTLNSWTGWIKLLDDSGYPNIWYYPSGC